MDGLAKIKRISIPVEKRVICVSDIHGELDLFKKLLDKVNFCNEDMLILLGDLYLKGNQCYDTLKFCIDISKNSNVHILRGNCDWGEDDYINDTDMQWLMELPHIIEAEEFVFVHSGLTSKNLAEQKAETCMKYDDFMNKATVFDKWIVAGHWPTTNYCVNIPCNNPIVNEQKRIIAIDGGNVLKADGQLNAFIIQGNCFSHMYMDNLPIIKINKAQKESGGSLSITWLDRFIEIVKEDGDLCYVKHIHTGKILVVPKSQIWTDSDGNTCVCDLATDYYLPCHIGETVSLVEAFPNRIFAKMNGTCGWIMVEDV